MTTLYTIGHVLANVRAPPLPREKGFHSAYRLFKSQWKA
jgi:hypothetical protein